MGKNKSTSILRALRERHGQTFAAEAGIHLKSEPAPLFQLLVLSLLSSARIAAPQAIGASRALFESGLTTPEKMRAATWEERVKVLNENGYARYDESTSRMLAETCKILHEAFRNDLRRLREEVDGDSGALEKRLQIFKGIGANGAAIFHREVQAVWDEVHPFFDDRALDGADALHLPRDPHKLANLVDSPAETAWLAAALVHVTLAKDAEEILAAA
ncbi:MAG: endonuclease [Verrucomicrobiota bacterium]